jgi:hypothetical protein
MHGNNRARWRQGNVRFRRVQGRDRFCSSFQPFNAQMPPVALERPGCTNGTEVPSTVVLYLARPLGFVRMQAKDPGWRVSGDKPALVRSD